MFYKPSAGNISFFGNFIQNFILIHFSGKFDYALNYILFFPLKIPFN